MLEVSDKDFKAAIVELLPQSSCECSSNGWKNRWSQQKKKTVVTNSIDRFNNSKDMKEERVIIIEDKSICKLPLT